MAKRQRRKFTPTKSQYEKRIAIIGGASITFEVRGLQRIGVQNMPLGVAQVWGAYGPAVASDGPAIAGKFVGVRYRWLRAAHGDESAKLFDSEAAAKLFAFAAVRKVKADKVPQTV